jgi:hypothetical protein
MAKAPKNPINAHKAMALKGSEPAQIPMMKKGGKVKKAVAKKRGGKC